MKAIVLDVAISDFKYNFVTVKQWQKLDFKRTLLYVQEYENFGF